MAITFPASPTLNQTTTTGGQLWIWNGTNWKAAASAAAAVYDTAAISTGYFSLPAGTTGERPASPTAGMTRWNTTLDVAEMWTGSTWYIYATTIQYISATGGVTTTSGNYKIHTFTSSGTFTPITVPTNSTIEYLVIAGGGAGGYDRGGGGGAGGLLTGIGFVVTPGVPINVIVGAGATASATHSDTPSKGGNSEFSTIISIGGGGGISADRTAGTTQVGGSGGGGAGQYINSGGAGVYPGSIYLNQTRQGYDGGTATYSPPYYGAGGGGGSTSNGGNGTSTIAGNGGTGTTSLISGSTVGYAGGGGGGTYGGGTAGTASFGGGTGGTTGVGSSGTTNTGGGGGGGGSTSNYAGGSGGSGIVIIRYLFQ